MLRSNKELYEFLRYRLDVSERLLLRDGKRISLPDKAFETLRVLVRRGGELVGKDELMGEVWSDAIVEENNVDQKISLIRHALGERGKSKKKFIETVRGRGYRFLPEVRRVEAEISPPSARSFETLFSEPGIGSRCEARRAGNAARPAKWRKENEAIAEPLPGETRGKIETKSIVGLEPRSTAPRTETKSLYLFRPHGRSAILAALALAALAASIFMAYRLFAGG
jgi:DNA-binding winged helix-turn-helix (wHTH) protein